MDLECCLYRTSMPTSVSGWVNLSKNLIHPTRKHLPRMFVESVTLISAAAAAAQVAHHQAIGLGEIGLCS